MLNQTTEHEPLWSLYCPLPAFRTVFYRGRQPARNKLRSHGVVLDTP